MSEPATESSSATTEINLSVVLPAYNEVALLSATVSNLVSGLTERGGDFEIVIVENGSSDETLRLAQVLAEELDSVRVLTLPVGNYGAALAAGLQAAKGHYVATFDVDYYDLAFLRAAVTKMESTNAGIVVASKRAPGAADKRPLPRRLVTLVFTVILQRFVGLQLSDAHGMKLFNRSIILPIVEATVLRDSLFDVELVIRAAHAGIVIEELPASVQERRPARTPVLLRALRAGRDIVKLRTILRKANLG